MPAGASGSPPHGVAGERARPIIGAPVRSPQPRSHRPGVRLRTATVIAFVVSLLVQVGFPLGVAIHYRRTTRAPWRVFYYGVLVYAVFQLFSWLPISTYLDTVIGARLSSDLHAFLWLLASALAAGLIEEFGRLMGFLLLFGRRGDALSWRNGVMYGLGSGAVETMLLIAGLTFVYLLIYLALTLDGTSAVMASLAGEASPTLSEAIAEVVSTSWAQPLIVAFERVVALSHQVAWALLVMQSLISQQKRWFGFAVLYHASIAVVVPGLVRLLGYPAAEAANAGFTLLSLWIIFALRATAEEREMA